MLAIVLATLSLAQASTQASAAGKIALVVGNSNYRHAQPLRNPRNDAAAVIEKLRELGFETVGGLDLTRTQFIAAIEKFSSALSENDVGLFYYSGHGFQLNGENFLVPVDMNPANTKDLEAGLVSLNHVLETMAKNNKTNLLFMDACRNNPFLGATEGRSLKLKKKKRKKARKKRKKRKKARKVRRKKERASKRKKQADAERGLARISGGLARVNASAGTMITFATQPGNVALDGRGDNSPFTGALLKHITVPEIDLPELLQRVRADVIEETDGKQIPWSNSSMLQNFYFTYPPDKAKREEELKQLTSEVAALKARLKSAGTASSEDISSDRATLLQKIEELQALQSQRSDEAAFAIARLSHTIASYKSYLAQHPTGDFREDADGRIETLRKLKEEWKGLAKARRFASLDNFVNRSAGTEFQPLAAQRRASLEEQERVEWDAAESNRTAHAYKGFLIRWPDGRQSDIAREKVDELRSIGLEWDKVKATNDKQALRDFIERHGWSEYGAEAVAVLVSLINPLEEESKVKGIHVLTAREIAKLLDRKKLVYLRENAEFTFNSKAMPRYRKRLGRKFLSSMLDEKFAAEGAFKASFKLKGKNFKIEGIGTIVESRVDKTGSIFLMQMHGKERNPNDVNRRDRKYTAIQMIKGPHGHVCIATEWAQLAAGGRPKKVVHDCAVRKISAK